MFCFCGLNLPLFMTKNNISPRFRKHFRFPSDSSEINFSGYLNSKQKSNRISAVLCFLTITLYLRLLKAANFSRIMIDHKFLIFSHLAKNPNMTKVAELLCLSQPAVSKSIKELEKELSVTLFDRVKGRLQLTPAGKFLFQQTEELLRQEREILFGIDRLRNTFCGTLRLGASTTLAQYILPEILAGFVNRYPRIHIEMVSGNTVQIEREMSDGNLHLAFIEGSPHLNDLHYIPFLKDEIVLVSTPAVATLPALRKEDLRKLKFVFREKDSGTYEIIAKSLKKAGISVSSLSEILSLGTTEGIKKYLMQTDCFALLSVYSIRDELLAGKLKITDVDDLIIERMFRIVHRQGYPDPYAQVFLDYALQYVQKRKG